MSCHFELGVSSDPAEGSELHEHGASTRRARGVVRDGVVEAMAEVHLERGEGRERGKTGIRLRIERAENQPFSHKLFGAASDSLKASSKYIRLLQQCLKPPNSLCLRRA